MIHTLGQLLEELPLFAGLAKAEIERIAACAVNEHAAPGELLSREGEFADRFFLIRRGSVTLQVHTPDGGEVVIGTLHEGDVLGWAWLLAPYRWPYDSRALRASRLIAVDAACLRGQFESNYELGYQLMGRFATALAETLHATRLQSLPRRS